MSSVAECTLASIAALDEILSSLSSLQTGSCSAAGAAVPSQSALSNLQSSLSSFCTLADCLFELRSHISTPIKQDLISKLLASLKHLEDLPMSVRFCIVHALKILSREVVASQALLTGEAQLLAADAINLTASATVYATDVRLAEEGLKLIMNITLQNKAALDAFHARSGIPRLCHQLEDTDSFLSCASAVKLTFLKVLFLVTALSSQCRDQFAENGFDSLIALLEAVCNNSQQDWLSPSTGLELSEILKILFTLTNSWGEYSKDSSSRTPAPADLQALRYLRIVKCMRRILLAEASGGKTHALVGFVVDLMVNTPIGFTGCLFGLQPVLQVATVSAPEHSTIMTERHWDPEDPKGTVTERVWEHGKLVTSVQVETNDPSVAKTFSSLPPDVLEQQVGADEEASTAGGSDSQVASSSSTFLFRQPLTEGDLFAIDTLLSYLKKQLDSDDLLTAITPIVGVLRLYALEIKAFQRHLKHKLLPRRKDMTKRPEEGSSLRARLIKLLTQSTQNVQHLAGELLFVLCRRNPVRLVFHVGYGNAAGLLSSYGMLAPPQDAPQDSDSEDDLEIDPNVNPVTGTLWGKKVDPAPMTEDEKERSAEELMSLIDRLNRNGIIRCQLPTEQPAPEN